jgi:GntR family transcriptional regulator
MASAVTMSPSQLDRITAQLAAAALHQPKYAALRSALIDAIRERVWEAGQKMPPEAELARLTALSLGTVQKAYTALAKEGFVERTQGRGTFVRGTAIPLEEPWHCRFLDEDGRLMKVVPQTLRRFDSDEPGPWTAFLALDRGEPAFVIDRRLEIGGLFAVVQRVRCRPDAIPSLRNCTLGEIDRVNIKVAISEAIRLPLTRIRHSVRAVVFPASVIEMLGGDVDPSGLLVEATASAGLHTPVYHQQIWVPRTPYSMALSDMPPGTE